jgi:AcrR family transcriptional regulator
MATTRLPRVERRAQILRAAASVFVEAGFDGTSMDDVARAAGVTRLIVYRIFESKYELYTAVLQEVMDDLREQFGPTPLELTDTPVDSDLSDQAVALRVVAVARRHPDAFRLLWRHAANEPEFAELAGLFRAIIFDFAEWLIAPAIPDGAMRRWASRTVTSYLYEGICLWLDEGVEQRDEEFGVVLAAGARAMVLAWAAQPVPR